MNDDNQQLARVLEGAIFAASEPLSVRKMQSLFESNAMPESSDILAALTSIQESYDERGVGLIEVASGWRFQVKEDLAPWVNRLWDEKPQKYSRALLETLSLIAYRQPITRGDIEEVRGVAVSSHIIKTLTERDWIKVVGHRDVPGRPALYATTKSFLDYFNLKSLDELPTLGELKDIDSLNQDLAFDENLSGQLDSSSEDDAEPSEDGLEALSNEQSSIFDTEEAMPNQATNASAADVASDDSDIAADEGSASEKNEP